MDNFWKPLFEKSGYHFEFRRGRRKVHGLVIAWKCKLFTLHLLEMIDLDCGTGDWPRPLRESRNIGLIVALESTKRKSLGFIIGSCHLFWHPEVGNLLRCVTQGILRAFTSIRNLVYRGCSDFEGHRLALCPSRRF